MVLHIVGDKLDGSILRSVNRRLALTEDYGRLEVCDSGRYLRSRLILTFLKSFMEAVNLLVLVSKNLIILSLLIVILFAETVDLCVESINLRLVATYGIDEVVCTVRVLKLINQAHVQLKSRTIDIIFHTLIAVAVESIVKGRLEIELPSFLFTEIECEVESYLRCKAVGGAEVLAIGEAMSPSQSVESRKLECARSTRITAKPVDKVNCSEE